jgi:hypothetical protein
VGDPALIGSTKTGYVLNVDPRSVDALEVLGTSEEVGGAARGG